MNAPNAPLGGVARALPASLGCRGVAAAQHDRKQPAAKSGRHLQRGRNLNILSLAESHPGA